jgi:transposase InsO family protein
VSLRQLQRWSQHPERPDGRKGSARLVQHALSENERNKILEIANSPEYCDLSPRRIVPALADMGIYLASESTFYRVLRANNCISHRQRWKAPTKREKPALVAKQPNQVWSWDISFLRSTVRVRFYYLYLFMDIFSRKIVGWEVLEREDSAAAASILRSACMLEGVSREQLTLHADNGAAMKGSTMLATMHWLGIVPSFSRPRTSNDNCYSESLFRTLKYSVQYPDTPFKNLDEARSWVTEFVHWYNHENLHSGINYVTPNERHQGKDAVKLAARHSVYEMAFRQNPKRWRRGVRSWEYQNVVFLNPTNETTWSEKKLRHLS